MISLLTACGPQPAPPWPPLLIGLTGRAGAGKDTAAGYLESEYGFIVTAFAEPLLDMIGTLAQHADVDGAWCIERALKEQPMPVLGRSYRELAQTLGTEWGRHLMGGLWLRIAAHKLAQARVRGDNVVFTDVRFPDEAEWLAAHGGVLVRIERPDRTCRVRPHISEAHTDTLAAEHTLCNSGSVSTLQNQLDLLMTHVRAAQS